MDGARHQWRADLVPAHDCGDVNDVGTGGNILEREVAVSVGQRRRDLAPEPEFLEPRGKQAHGPIRQR